jgi:hypothetical protein
MKSYYFFKFNKHLLLNYYLFFYIYRNIIHYLIYNNLEYIIKGYLFNHMLKIIKFQLIITISINLSKSHLIFKFKLL